MRTVDLVALGALLTPSLSSAAPAPLPRDVQFTMPASFQGEWNQNTKHCGTGLNDSSLRITSTFVRYYESGGPVKAVVRRGAFEVMFVAELSGEGHSWLASDHFILSSDGRYLTRPSDGDGPDFIRYRCPTK